MATMVLPLCVLMLAHMQGARPFAPWGGPDVGLNIVKCFVQFFLMCTFAHGKNMRELNKSVIN